MARVTVPWLLAVIVTVGAAAAGVEPPSLPPPPPQPTRPTAPNTAAIRNRFTALPSVEMTRANVVGCHCSLAKPAKEARRLRSIAKARRPWP